MKLAFNTGRAYTRFGQRIVIMQAGTSDVFLFRDFDRHIEGRVTLNPAGLTPEMVRSIVMAAYDNGTDYWSALTFEDGQMLRALKVDEFFEPDGQPKDL